MDAKPEHWPSSQDPFIRQVAEKCLTDWIRPQRIHPLRSIQRAFLLREDEHGFGISGTKRRKLASLIPWLQAHGFEQVVLIGGANSNHIVSALQACHEHGIRAHSFLLENHQQSTTGNAWLTSILTDSVTWVPRQQWPDIHSMAYSWADQQQERTYVVPEGACCMPALAGASTLPFSWVNREDYYDHVWMDAGTGLNAVAATLMAGRLAMKTQIHIVQVAGIHDEFHHVLHQASDWWEAVMGEAAPAPAEFHLYPPATARSFGSVNAGVWQEVKRMAREEGVLADPIYTAKLTLTARSFIPDLPGSHLIVHGGGGTGLMGFAGK